MLCSCYFNMTHAIDLFVIHFSVIAVYSNMSTMFNSSVEDPRLGCVLHREDSLYFDDTIRICSRGPSYCTMYVSFFHSFSTMDVIHVLSHLLFFHRSFDHVTDNNVYDHHYDRVGHTCILICDLRY